jgi:hypothetical protein
MRWVRTVLDIVDLRANFSFSLEKLFLVPSQPAGSRLSIP